MVVKLKICKLNASSFLSNDRYYIVQRACSVLVSLHRNSKIKIEFLCLFSIFSIWVQVDVLRRFEFKHCFLHQYCREVFVLLSTLPL